MARIAVSVVPHTHWDREWYSSFQTFRLRLVDLLDDVLPRLEQEGALPHFLLDGQLAMVDDYLEVRPEAQDAIRRLNERGRVSIGPWYVLMDEFLVSGETMIRDLQRGLARAEDFGGAMQVGYLPDMFGHVAQMPQLLRQFGFEHAVVWRGVPASVDRDAFWWTSPDGSTVRAQYLWPEGYGNGARCPDDGAGLVEQVRDHLEVMGSHATRTLLWMHGTDHQVPSPSIQRVVDEANALQDDLVFDVTSLRSHVEHATTDGLPTVCGELRSGARANLLMGVASNRVDVKQAAARAERALERRAEPLSALFLDPARWPAALLDMAWLQVIRNAAHDSVCACSADEVVAAVLHRYHEAIDIGEGLATRALDAAAASMSAPGPVVVNAGARPRAGVVDIPGHGLARVSVPGFGWTAWSATTIDDAAPVRTTPTSMANGLVSVEVDAHDGTFAIDGLRGLDRLVDGGDVGDTYNYCPPPDDRVVDAPSSVEVEVADAHPLRGRLRVTRTFAGARPVTVATTLELHAGERLVRITTELDNERDDHRLRSHFPLPERASFTRAECAFAIVERGLTAEGGPHEQPLPTFPSRRFVSAGGLTLVHEGLLEYELIENGAVIALTLLRATGILSRPDLPTRPLDAGPALPLRGAQLRGHHVLRYGVAVGDADPYALVDDAFLPMEVVAGSGRGALPPSGSKLTVEGAEVSALRRADGGALELRVFNPTDHDTDVVVPGRRGHLTDLRGNTLGPFDGACRLGPWRIATLLLNGEG